MTDAKEHQGPLKADEIQPKFRDTVTSAVRDALLCIEQHVSRGEYLGVVHGRRKVEYRPDGMPRFADGSEGTRDYMYALQTGFGTPPRPDPTERLESFARLESLVTGNEFLRERIIPYWLPSEPDADSVLKELIPWSARHIAKSLAVRYVEAKGATAFNEEAFNAIYTPYERSVFDETLHVEVCVPILFLRFSFEELRIDEDVVIAKMTDPFQLARYPSSPHGPGPYEMVLASATHMLVLENWQVANRNQYRLSELFANRDSFPVGQVDNFFAALRITKGVSSGYCQLLLRPVGWSTLLREGPSEEAHGTTIRAYPSEFDNFYWNLESFEELRVHDVSECGVVYRRLASAAENSMAIAVRRLNRCYCRDDEDDWVLDAAIALEALLLADSDGNELVHKLALRTAALSRFYPSQRKTAQEVFEDIKAVYRLRSKIVHGKSPKSHDRQISVGRDVPIPTSVIAREHLRMVLRVLINSPEYRDVKAIDRLILGSLTLPSSSASESLPSDPGVA